MFLGGVTPKVMCPWEKNDSKMTPVTCVHSACACHFFRRSVKNQKIEMILGPQSDSQSVTKSHNELRNRLGHDLVVALMRNAMNAENFDGILNDQFIWDDIWDGNGDVGDLARAFADMARQDAEDDDG